MSLATEPLVRPARLARIRDPLLAAGGVAAAALALHLRDPHVTHSWGFCPLYAATGVYCPGCGSLRAVNDLTNGHLGAAASSNLLLVALIPVVAVLFGRWTLASWRGDDVAFAPRLPRWVTIGMIAVVGVFWVARNLPGSWLAP
jgi:drug/metabolite transporter (DMT)-like permease